MASYAGSLRVAATADVVDAVFEVSEDSLRVTSGGEVLGTWALPDVSLENRDDGIHVSLAGEQVVVSVPNPDSFVAALAPPRRRPKGRHDKKRAQSRVRKRPVQPAPVQPAPAAPDPEVLVADRFDEPVPAQAVPKPKKERRRGPGFLARVRSVRVVFDTDNWGSWLQDRLVRWTIAAVGVMILALVVLLAANTLGMILVLVGMVALIIAALSASDDLSAYRLVPNVLNETTMVIAGAAAMAIGALLILIS
jgi:hypothetical protein